MQRRSEPALKLQVYLPAWLKQEVEHEAKEDGRILSVCVERALTEHFKGKMAARDAVGSVSRGPGRIERPVP